MNWKYEKNFTERGYRMKYEDSGKRSSDQKIVYQFLIKLLEVEPVVWRRIQVPPGYNFWDLHVAIQDSMGWQDYHTHHFAIRAKHKREEVHIGIPDFGRTYELKEVYPGWEILMIAYFNGLGIEARYEYDYGDGWEHSVKLEGYMHREKGVKYPICIDGERACPPEDCGGPSRYNEYLNILSNPDAIDKAEAPDWLENWDPDAFRKEDVKFDNPYKRWKHAFLED